MLELKKIFMCMCEHVCYLCIGAIRDQKRVLDPPDLELQEDISHLVWIMATKLVSSGRATSTLNH